MRAHISWISEIFGAWGLRRYMAQTRLSERFRMHPIAAERIRVGPNRSKHVPEATKTSENLQQIQKLAKLAKNTDIFRFRFFGVFSLAKRRTELRIGHHADLELPDIFFGASEPPRADKIAKQKFLLRNLSKKIAKFFAIVAFVPSLFLWRRRRCRQIRS